MNISLLFFNAAKAYPKQLAIIDKNREIDYETLAKEVMQTSAYFQKKGIKKGDRVLVFVPMSIDLYRIVLALFHCGATAVFLDEWVTKKRMELCCEIAQCKGFIGIAKARVLGLFSKQLRAIPIKLKQTGKLKIAGKLCEVKGDDSALISFTTGSTGVPKAANRTHEFLKAQFDALLDEIEPKVTDVDMPLLPIVLFMNLGMGCTSVIADVKLSKLEETNLNVVVKLMKKCSVNRITSSPIFIEKLSALGNNENTVFEQVDKIFIGGAPVFPNQAATFKKAFPNTVIKIVYGSTEAEPISSINAKELIKKEKALKKGLPVGIPYSQSEVKIIKLNQKDISNLNPKMFELLSCKKGEVGEIVVAGPHVLKRYFNNETAFAENKIIVGDTIWHRTGDSGFLIENELYLTGRCKELIEWNDQLISPFVIENQLQLINGVTMGTLMKMKGELILILDAINDENLLQVIPDNVVYTSLKFMKIPRDPRHHSKIDYAKLRSDLEEKG